MVLDTGEAGCLQHGVRRLPAPHGAETCSALSQRNGHAMEAGYGIEQRRQREVPVVLQSSGSSNVLHQVGAARLQRPIKRSQERLWVLLIVNGVKGGDEVIALVLGEVAQISLFEADIR